MTDEVTAYRHSLAAIAQQCQAMLGPGVAPGDARKTWVSHCEHAQLVCQEVEADLGVTWPTPAFFAGWRNVVTDPSPKRVA